MKDVLWLALFLALVGCASKQAVAASFGFSGPPKINLNIDSNASKFRRGAPKGDRAGGKGRGSGHMFSASNPYGKRQQGDKRQFSRT